MLQYITTESGTVYEVDNADHKIRRISEKPLVFMDLVNDNFSDWKFFDHISLFNRYNDGGMCLYVDYLDGTWTCSTNIVRVQGADGADAEVILLGRAMLAGVNEKYNAHPVDFIRSE